MHTWSSNWSELNYDDKEKKKKKEKRKKKLANRVHDMHDDSIDMIVAS